MKHIYRIFIFLSIVLLIGALGLTFMFMPRGEKLSENKNTETEEKVVEPRKASVFNEDKDIVNILLLGIDSSEVTYEVDENSKRADTIMVLSIDPKINKVRLLSVPRDTKYKIKGYDNYRINAAYSRGGIELQVSSVEDLLGIDIDHYITVNYEAVKELVDAIGGVEVYTPEYHYLDPSTVPPLEINFEEGLHLLDGEESVKYLRMRKIYENQDIDRIKAQQDFIMKLFDKMKSPKMILKLPRLISIANRHVETDLSYGELAYLAYYGLSLEKDDIEMTMIEGEVKYPYYVVDKDNVRYQVKQFEKLRDDVDNNRNVDDENLTEEEKEEKQKNKELRDRIEREATKKSSSANSNKSKNSEN